MFKCFCHGLEDFPELQISSWVSLFVSRQYPNLIILAVKAPAMSILKNIFGINHPQAILPGDRELNNYRHARRRAAGVSGPEMRRRRQQAKDDFAEWQKDMWTQIDREKAEAEYRAAEYEGENEMNRLAREKAKKKEMRYMTSLE